MIRLQGILKIRPNETRMVSLMVGMMFIASASSSIGTPAADALFFTRFGVRFLPYMYVILGLVTIALAMLITIMLGTVPRHRLYAAIPLVVGSALLLSRFILILDLNAFYPILWLEVSATWTLQGLFTWGIAGAICDARQAKRLFPLFGAGNILGLSAGGLVTRPLVQLFGAENLLLVWAVGFFAAFLVGRTLLGRSTAAARQVGQRQPAGPRDGPVAEIRQGFNYVRQSELLRWLSLAALFFAVLYFSLTFPFAEAATARFSNADDLSGFLGVFQGTTTGVAFLASLFVANRLYARLGITNMVLAYTGLYFSGFLALSVLPTFYTLVGFRFLQLFWYQGIAGTAYQAIYNAIPSDRRDQTRTFIDGIPGQIGIMLAGIYLLLSQQILTSQQNFIGATFVAALTMYFALRASRAYRGALVDALREGRPQLFVSEEQPFWAFQRDAAAIAAVVAGVSHPDPIVRRVSAEILGNLPVPEARDALVEALEDEDARVRAALLRSLARSDAAPALLEILACLDDPEPQVRLEALMSLRQLAGYARGLISQIMPLLGDRNAAVRANAAVTLLRYGPHEKARSLLRQMVTDPAPDTRLEALRAIASWGQASEYNLAAGLIQDSVAVVRREAVQAVASTDPGRCIELLVATLGDEDRSVRQTAAAAVAGIGEPALELTVRALQYPSRQEGALLSLENMPHHSRAADLEAYVHKKREAALHYYALALQVQSNNHDERRELLYTAVRKRAIQDGVYALRAFGLLHDQPAVKVAVEHLEDPNPDGRANALEILDSVKGSAIIRDLFAIWENAATHGVTSNGWLLALLRDEDPWLRACAVLVAGQLPDPSYEERLAKMAANDASQFVREAAASAIIKGDRALETLQTLSNMERILFLRRVSLFADLSPTDLMHIASVGRESLFQEGEIIIRQGETGDVMYIIVAGEISVQVDAGDAHPIEVARRGPGEYVGEMAIISHEPRMATLVADGVVRTLCLDRSSFEAILRDRPEASLAVMRVLCDRLRENTQTDGHS